jgi:chemotaxis protein histidine kinase CheA
LSSAEQFKQSFREEAREVLVDLEAALLELNENRADDELVGRVFRALHTIKGSGSMFGFENLAAFTHNLETAFDEVRNGRFRHRRILNNAEDAFRCSPALIRIGIPVSSSAPIKSAKQRRLFWISDCSASEPLIRGGLFFTNQPHSRTPMPLHMS